MLLDKRIGLANVRAHIELMPAQGAFQLRLQGKDDDDTVETTFAWLMTPDIAPTAKPPGPSWKRCWKRTILPATRIKTVCTDVLFAVRSTRPARRLALCR